MDAPLPNEITQQLIAWSKGDATALERLIPTVYQELRRMADRYLRAESAGHSLQPTALVHEAYLRLIDQTQVEWQNRAHFFGVAAQMMRRILVDHARSKQREKRGGHARNLPLNEAGYFSHERAAELVELDDALQLLADIDARKSRVVELRYRRADHRRDGPGVGDCTQHCHPRLEYGQGVALSTARQDR